MEKGMKRVRKGRREEGSSEGWAGGDGEKLEGVRGRR